jgi:hypothetical protein
MNTIYIVSLFFKDNPKPVDYEFIDEAEAKRNLAIWTNLSMHMDIKIKFSIKKQPKDDAKKIEKLKKDYEKVCNQYMKLFCEKQDLGFDGFVGDEVGGVACCNDFFFNFQDIVWDVNAKIPKGVIIEWYDAQLENPEKAINYYSYTKGLRHQDIK